MARHIVILNPDKEEDKERLFFLEHGWKFRHIISEIDDKLRSKLKYEKLHPETDKELEYLRDYIWDLLNDFHLDPHGE